jgi:glycosyltransferase involved in cell wall biosynthesis
MQNKNVIFLISALSIGGLENYLLRFLKLNYLEFDKIVVVCKHGYGGVLESEYLKLPNVEIKYIRLSYFNVFEYLSFLIFLRKSKLNTLCDFTGHFSAIVILTARIAGIKKRIVFYRDTNFQFNITKLKLIYTKLLKFILKIGAPRILSNSKSALDLYHQNWELNKEKFKIIQNGVYLNELPNSFDKDELRKNLGIPYDSFVIGHVGNFRKAKNHNAIFAVAKLLIKEFPNLIILLVGNGVQKGLEDLIKDKNLQSHFIIIENETEVSVFLKIMDIFFFPSISEGQPNALIEAMLQEVPVFASNIPAILECTPDEIHSNLFNPNDYNSFKKSMISFMNSESSYDTKVVSSWAKLKFNPETNFKKFLDELI